MGCSGINGIWNDGMEGKNGKGSESREIFENTRKSAGKLP
jgi:hypothetical protein